MDETKLIQSATGLIGDILKVLANHGPEGLIGLFILWKHYIQPRQKKKNGTYESWAVMSQRIDNISMRVSSVQNTCDHRNEKLGEHLELENEENIRIERMENKIMEIEKTIETENRHIFNQFASVFKKMDDQGNDLKEILKLMIERKA